MRYRVLFETQQPLVTADGPQAGNFIETLGYIPGSAVWGALGGRAARSLRMDDPAQRALFDEAFNGSKALRFNNLYPALLVFDEFDATAATLIPSRPVPRSAVTCKAVPGFRSDRISPLRGIARGHGVSDEVTGHHPNCQSCHARTERVSVEFYTVSVAGAAGSFAPSKSYRVHNEIDDVRGRTKHGKLFAVLGLGRRQFFVGSIEVSDVHPQSGGSWLDLLPTADGAGHPLVLGKRRGSYGGGCMRLELDVPDATCDLWGYTLAERLERTRDGVFNVTLDSDAIIVDEWLQHRADLEPMRAKWQADLGHEIEPTEAWVATRSYAGWNGVDGCPREPELLTAAGSVFTFRAPTADPQELADLLGRAEAEGVGLRRNEGFGKIIINDSFHTAQGIAAGLDAR